jgi:hypothetical protein
MRINLAVDGFDPLIGYFNYADRSKPDLSQHPGFL